MYHQAFVLGEWRQGFASAIGMIPKDRQEDEGARHIGVAPFFMAAHHA